MTVSRVSSASLVLAFFGSRAFSAALATTVIGTAFAVHLIKSTMGVGGWVGIVVGLVVLAALSLFAQRRELEWHGLLPISLILFVLWSAVSIIWTHYQAATAVGVAYQLGFAFLGIYVALVRDLIQIVRALGDVLRVLLTVSMALEILSGILIDLPIKFLGILGNLDQAGPLQGIFGSRNMLGFIALVALVTFAIELATRSVQRGLAVYSLVLAAALVLLSGSPISMGIAAVTAIAAAAILLLRRVTAELRRILQITMLVALVATTVGAYFMRGRLLELLGARAEFDYRLEIWRELGRLIDLNQLEGWGWIGIWNPKISPFFALDIVGSKAHTSALNAYFDVYFQVGLVGVAIFLGMVGLALVRSWILATSRKSVIYLWPALMLVVLLTTSLAESSMLFEYGWLLFVMCAVKVAHSLSWRQGLALKT